MKNITLLLSFLLISLSASAGPRFSIENSGTYNFGAPFIFVERGVEFAVYPDGQFDFFYNPNGYNHLNSPLANMSYNAGYNYNPFVQYDDFGAVIQIETVPVYYDFYGRIARAGNISISYNRFGMLDRIGRMKIHYNRFNQFTHSTGFINSYNVRYAARPWHDYYMRPQANHIIVYNQPYRAYYNVNRMDYNYYRDYYDTYYNGIGNNFQRSYYRPGEKIVSYHRGTRSERVRDIEKEYSSKNNNKSSRTRSNAGGNRDLIINSVERSAVRNSGEVTSEAKQARRIRSTRTREIAPAAIENRSVRAREKAPAEARSKVKRTRVESPVEVQPEVRRPRVEKPVEVRKAPVEAHREVRRPRVEKPVEARAPVEVPQRSSAARSSSPTVRNTPAQPQETRSSRKIRGRD